MNYAKLISRVAAAAASLALLAQAASAETLRWATWPPETAVFQQVTITKWYADEFKKRTNGEYDIRVYWGGTLASQAEIPQAVGAGVADIGDLVVPYFPDEYFVNNAISRFWPQPNSPFELGQLMVSWHEKYPPFSEELTRNNLKLLGMRPLAPTGMLCVQPVRTMEDFKGKRIRSFGVALPAVIEALGAVPVSMSSVEAYEALQRGILDCSPISEAEGHFSKWDEVAKYYIDVPMGASWGHFIVINLEKYDALPENIRKIITDIGIEHLKVYTDEMARLNAETRENWKKQATVTVIEDFPKDEFLKTVLGNPGVQAVRQEWIDGATDRGVPADEIAKAFSQ